jgi:hypothetical protein
MAKQCFCFIRHANTPAERAAAKKSLDAARMSGDTTRMTIAMAALSGGCPKAAKACK